MTLSGRASAAVAIAVEAPQSVAPVSIGASVGASLSASPLWAVPGAMSLAPTLSTSRTLSPAAFDALLGVTPRAGAVRFAPTALPAAAAPEAAPVAASAESAAAAPAAPAAAASAAASATPGDVLPPSSRPGTGVTTAGAPLRRATAPGASLDARLEAARDALVAPVEADSAVGASPEQAAAAGRRFWDAASSGADFSGVLALPEGVSDASASGASGRARATAASGADGGALRDAVAAALDRRVLINGALTPGGAAALAAGGADRAGGAFAAADTARTARGISFERLSLLLGAGLVVRVRGALGASAAGGAALAPRGAAAAVRTRRAAPVTSTEWLERRALFETLSELPELFPDASAAPGRDVSLAATRVPAAASASVFAAASAASAAPARAAFPWTWPADDATASTLAWWALALVPALLAFSRGTPR